MAGIAAPLQSRPKRSFPSPCPATYKETVLVGTPRPKKTAGKTYEGTAMAKELQGAVEKIPNTRTPHPFGIDFTVSCSMEWHLHTRDP